MYTTHTVVTLLLLALYAQHTGAVAVDTTYYVYHVISLNVTCPALVAPFTDRWFICDNSCYSQYSCKLAVVDGVYVAIVTRFNGSSTTCCATQNGYFDTYCYEQSMVSNTTYVLNRCYQWPDPALPWLHVAYTSVTPTGQNRTYSDSKFIYVAPNWLKTDNSSVWQPSAAQGAGSWQPTQYGLGSGPPQGQSGAAAARFAPAGALAVFALAAVLLF